MKAALLLLLIAPVMAVQPLAAPQRSIDMIHATPTGQSGEFICIIWPSWCNHH